MNKRANLYLNIYGIILFILSLSCLGTILMLKEVTYSIPLLMRLLFTIVGIISGLLFISIEVFLFILMNNKSRLIYTGYIILDLLIAIILNAFIPFSAFLVFIVLKIVKDSLKIKLVDKIYLPKEFDRYCRMFKIKVPDFRKKRVSNVKTKTKAEINISVEDEVEEQVSNAKSKRRKSPALEKAI